MKKCLIAILIFVLYMQSAFAEVSSEVRCPTQPKSQHNINQIFFSFTPKKANLYSYLPKNLVLVDSQYLKNGPRCLTSQTYNAFVLMNDALKIETGQSLVVSSAWRSPKTQMYFAKNRGEFAAVPGRSEHQLGTTMDLDILGAKEEDYFGDSTTYKWMLLYAKKYGFVQSFNAEGEVVTGIPNEPWHWRFVGKSIATKVTDENININQYLYERAEAKKKGLICRFILPNSC